MGVALLYPISVLLRVGIAVGRELVRTSDGLPRVHAEGPGGPDAMNTRWPLSPKHEQEPLVDAHYRAVRSGRESPSARAEGQGVSACRQDASPSSLLRSSSLR